MPLYSLLDWLNHNATWFSTGIGAALAVGLAKYLVAWWKDRLINHAEIKKYLDALNAKSSMWRGLGLGRDVHIEDIYIHHVVKTVFGQKTVSVPETEFVRQVVGDRKGHVAVVVEGPAGTGKTTLLRHLANLLSEKRTTPRGCRRLPVLLSLRDMGTRIEEKASLTELATDHFRAVFQEDSPKLDCILKEVIRNGKALILLDAFDEVAPNHIELVRSWIDDVRASSKCPIILTSRPYGMCSSLRGFKSHFITIFDATQQAEFIHKWFESASRAGAVEADRGQTLAREMKAFLRTTNLRLCPEICGNPLFLTMMCIDHEVRRSRDGDGDELAPSAGKLLDRFARILLFEWDRDKGAVRVRTTTADLNDGEKLLDLLGTMAAGMFKKEKFDVEVSELHGLDASLAQTLNQVGLNSGLLVADSKGRYRFSHTLFLEYFMARHLLSESSDARQEWIRSQEDNPRRMSVLGLYAELVQGAARA